MTNPFLFLNDPIIILLFCIDEDRLPWYNKAEVMEMKQIDFGDIFTGQVAITEVSVIHQTNQWSVFSPPNGRICNGFLLIDGGECTYSWGENKLSVGEGTLLYLPMGSCHTVIAPERSLNFYRINFTLVDAKDGFPVVFSREPWCVLEDAGRHLNTLCEELCQATLSENVFMKRVSLLAELFDRVRQLLNKKGRGRVTAAIEYIETHYTEDFDIATLSALCYMSEAHLFRLFKQEVGLSPVEYKNLLRVRKAEELLLDEEFGVSEIADLLGFENACYFSRIFKKLNGLSPLQYRKGRNAR